MIYFTNYSKSLAQKRLSRQTKIPPEKAEFYKKDEILIRFRRILS